MIFPHNIPLPIKKKETYKKILRILLLFCPKAFRIPIILVRSKIMINNPEIMVNPATESISAKITTTLMSSTSSQLKIIGFNSLIVDVNIINAIIDAVSQMDAMKVKELLTTLNQSLNNETLGFLVNVNDTSFNAIFNWLTTGIPMQVTSKEGHTYIYLDKEGFTPIAKLLPDLSPLIVSMLPEDMQGLGFIISAFLNGISEAFLSPERIEFGLELIPNK